MITHIQGKLVEKNPTDVVIDCNGVGYLLNISLHTFSQIPDTENLKLYTHLQVKEDSHTLFGFSSLSEREMFKLLISVSGIGASIARTMLSSLTPKQIREGIATSDVALIQSIKGGQFGVALAFKGCFFFNGNMFIGYAKHISIQS